MESLRYRIFQIIEKGDDSDKPSVVFDISVIVCILLSIVSIIIESFEPTNIVVQRILKVTEYVTVIFFSIEYLLRLFTADLKYPCDNKIGSEIKYIFTFMAIIDLISILPFYLPINLDLRFLRILRLLKVARYNHSFKVVSDVFKKKKSELATTVFVTLVLLLLSSTLMYYVENKAQPNEFPNIVAALWWGITTLTTVGYGDVFPITAAGKFLSGLISFLGIGIVALPTGIISSGFIAEMKDPQKGDFKNICPHCGKHIDDLS